MNLYHQYPLNWHDNEILYICTHFCTRFHSNRFLKVGCSSITRSVTSETRSSELEFFGSKRILIITALCLTPSHPSSIRLGVPSQLQKKIVIIAILSWWWRDCSYTAIFSWWWLARLFIYCHLQLMMARLFIYCHLQLLRLFILFFLEKLRQDSVCIQQFFMHFCNYFADNFPRFANAKEEFYMLLMFIQVFIYIISNNYTLYI